MTLGDRIHEKLVSAFAGATPSVDVRPPEKGAEAGFVDLYCHPGVHDGREWEILQSVGFGPAGIEVSKAGIHSAVPGGEQEYLCDADATHGHDVPATVRSAALRIESVTHEAELLDMRLNEWGRILLDTLAEIAVAQAKEDEEALAAAMEAGRDVVLTYRPALASLLAPRSGGMAP